MLKKVGFSLIEILFTILILSTVISIGIYNFKVLKIDSIVWIANWKDNVVILPCYDYITNKYENKDNCNFYSVCQLNFWTTWFTNITDDNINGNVNLNDFRWRKNCKIYSLNKNIVGVLFQKVKD